MIVGSPIKKKKPHFRRESSEGAGKMNHSKDQGSQQQVDDRRSIPTMSPPVKITIGGNDTVMVSPTSRLRSSPTKTFVPHPTHPAGNQSYMMNSLPPAPVSHAASQPITSHQTSVIQQTPPSPVLTVPPVKPVTHPLPQQPSRPVGLATAKPLTKSIVPPQQVTNTVVPSLPISPPLMVNSPDRRVPDFHPMSPHKSHSADNLLDFYLGGEDSSSPKPSPPKIAPPAPPGATISASGVGIRFGSSSSNNNLSNVPAVSTPNSGVVNSIRAPPNDKTLPVHAKKDTFKLKNATSWSSLANMSAPSSSKKPNAMQSFELFKKQAKQKEEREKIMKEQEERRRMMKETEEKNRQQSEIERMREREEEEALDMARRAVSQQDAEAARQREADKKAKEIERRKEQERRRREATANMIDLNAQSEMMASFEEMM